MAVRLYNISENEAITLVDKDDDYNFLKDNETAHG